MAPCPTNLLNALLCRHLAVPTNPIHSLVAPYTTKLIGNLLPLYQSEYVQHNDRWMVGRGKSKLANIQESSQIDPVKHDQVLMMIKREKNTSMFSEPKFPKKARGIQYPKNLRTAYENAPEQTSFCHALASLYEQGPVIYGGVMFDIRYASNMNHDQIGEFVTQSENARASYGWCCIDERDGVNWDANIQVAHREHNERIYDQIDPKLAESARQARHVHGKCQARKDAECAKISYEVDGTVKSGEWDTASGNALTNIDISVEGIVLLPPNYRPAYVRMLVLGDDYLAHMYYAKRVEDPQVLCDLLSSMDAKHGIHPERGLFTDIRHASFISLAFFLTVTGRVVARPKPGRILARLFWSTNYHPDCWRGISSEIARSILPSFFRHPLLDPWLRSVLHADVSEKERKRAGEWVKEMRTTEWGELRSVTTDYCWDVDWESADLFRYGLLPGSHEQTVRALKDFRIALIHSTAVDIMIKEDMCDPMDRRGCIAH